MAAPLQLEWRFLLEKDKNVRIVSPPKKSVETRPEMENSPAKLDAFFLAVNPRNKQLNTQNIETESSLAQKILVARKAEKKQPGRSENGLTTGV